MKNWRVLSLSFLLLFLSWCTFLRSAHAQAPELETQLTTLSLSIRGELQNLRQQTDSLQSDLLLTTELLRAQSEDLRLSETERQVLEIQRTELITSLENTNASFGNLFENFVRVDERLRIEQRRVRILALIVGGFILLRVVSGIVRLRWPVVNRLIPKWLDVFIL